MDSSQVRKIFSKIVGPENVATGIKQVIEAQTSTYKTNQKVLGIVRPGSVEQVQNIVEIAKQKGIRLYVYSTGKNWGYGSRVPQANNSLLVDLGRMNKILNYNKDLGYVTLEPGVTQQQLYDFLRRKNARFSLGVTGSSPDTSIIGNICERGVGAGLNGFRSHHISELEIILPSGECIHTGYGRFANAKAAKTYPEGIGPSFYDIFLQSNFGIITKLTMFLTPTPAYVRFIDISISDDEALQKYLKLFRTFNLYSAARKVITFRKDIQILPRSIHQYPWHLTDNKAPLPTDVLNQLKEEYDINYDWKASVAIYGYTSQEINAQVAYFKSLGKGLGGAKLTPLFTKDTLGNGPRPLGNNLYWRMRTSPPLIKNPDTDGCGLIQLSVAVPFIVGDITRVIKMMEKVITQFKYEPFLEGHCISERTVVIIAPIVFDRTIPGEDENALKCHDTLLKALTQKGYYPYRDNGRAMTKFPDSSDDYDSFQMTIKNAIDPDNILSPGRYEVG